LKPTEQLLNEFREKFSRSMDEGFSGTRASGSTVWITQPDTMKQFIDDEAQVHCAIVAVCSYPARLGPCRLRMNSFTKTAPCS
jgi:hypothetical protein